MRSKLTRRGTKGFTLIELLTVISIIAVLAAILFPVFAQAREMARGTACISNIKNINTSTAMYSQDYDESIIAWRNCPVQIPGGVTPIKEQVAATWTNTLQPYLKNSQIFFCPSFSEANAEKAMDQEDCDGDGTPGSGSAGFLPAEINMAHYALGLPITFNGGQCDTTGSAPYAHYAGSGWTNSGGTYHFFQQTLSSVVNVSRTVFVGDGLTVQANTPGGPVLGTLLGCESRFRHRGGANFGMLDGHTKWISNNPERHVAQDSNGCYFEEYFTSDK